ncbi:MAG: hypothetical protein KatS3mg031_2936 [Chitinophagales bacterium]|nr:MAG: hypothetical protein KatS3mg031_2936 [Chitinophagales bacterium]
MFLKKFLASTKKMLTGSVASLYNICAERLGNYYDYDTITLKRFLAIHKTKKLRLLLRRGIYIKNIAIKKWEALIHENERQSKTNKISNYKVSLKRFIITTSNYIAVKAALLALCLKVDKELLEYVRNAGYNIDTSSSSAYNQSLSNALQQVENLASLATSLKNETHQLVSDKTTPNHAEYIAALSISLGFPLKDDILLSEFNAYLSAVKEMKKNERAQTTRLVQR